MKIISLFSGCGGLDLGFENAGFKVVWANDFDRCTWETYEANFPHTKLDTKNIIEVLTKDIPDAIGIIGGPPCQSWSLAGKMRGLDDNRGKVFYEYLRILKRKRPLFFLAENVPGIISKAHKDSFEKILGEFGKIGYNTNAILLNAADYSVPQERKRVFVVGYLKGKIKKFFRSPQPKWERLALKDAIDDLPEPLPARERNRTNNEKELKMPNHEYMTGGFSSIYMSRNRKRDWNQLSFTIQAGGRHAPLYPASNGMIKKGKDLWEFDKRTKYPYRRLSVRECARIQTFPDDFVFKYQRVAEGYKMVGNAVPIKLAEAIAKKIRQDIKGIK